MIRFPARLVLPSFSLVVSMLALSCSSSDSPPADAPKDTGGSDSTSDTPVVTDGASEGGPADPIADPVPTDLPAVVAVGTGGDVAPDFSCAGKPLPVRASAAADHAFNMFDLGGNAETDGIAGATIELFASDTISGTPDVTATSGTADKKGLFNATIAGDYIGVHVAAFANYYETIQLDIPTTSAVTLVNAAPKGQIDALSTIIGGSTFTPTPGTTRLVVRTVDCQLRPIANAHVALEIDGVVTPIAKSAPGVLRSYFGDSELPSSGKWTSHNGIVAFLEVPIDKTLRLVARAKADASSPPSAISLRATPRKGDAIVTALLTPYVAPAP